MSSLVVMSDVYIKHKQTYEDNLKFLYELMKEREKHVNISHKEMPTFLEHRIFVDRRPYSYWWIIEKAFGGAPVGAMYLTDKREIGLFVRKEHQGQGYGDTALEHVKDMLGRPIYANINPENKQSAKFFSERGFVPYTTLSYTLTGLPIQNTYRWR